MRKYRVVDTHRPLLERAPVVEAKSPIDAVRQIFPSSNIKRSDYHGRVVVEQVEHPYRTYSYSVG